MKITDYDNLEIGNFVVANIKYKTFICQIRTFVQSGYQDSIGCKVLYGHNKRNIKIERDILKHSNNYEVFDSIDDVKEFYPEAFI